MHSGGGRIKYRDVEIGKHSWANRGNPYTNDDDV